MQNNSLIISLSPDMRRVEEKDQAKSGLKRSGLKRSGLK
jgi:hypothetical protein